MSNENINENAAGGSTGAGSIASSHSRHADKGEWQDTLAREKKEREVSANNKAQLAKYRELKAKKAKEKRGSFSSFFRRKISEDLDINSIVSQLKGIENANDPSVSTVVSYGIEDDKGNVMRVTVSSEQSKEFEMTIARMLADNKEDVDLGLSSQKNSLAEILFDLQKKFDIKDVEFPTIPKDAVYNADEATVGQAAATPGADVQAGADDLSLDGSGADAGLGMDASLDATGSDGASLDADVSLDSGTGGTDDLGLGGDEELDGDNVEDFQETPTSSSDPGSLLASLVDMLKKQAEAETAKANAAAEQARASQAEWSAIASNKEVERQEEFARVQADLDEKKRKEKMAKQYAELARYNVTQGKQALNQVGEGVEIESSILYSVLLAEADDTDNVGALQKAKQELVNKYRVEAGDSALTKNYKNAALRLEMTSINARIQLANLTTQYTQQQQKVNQQPQPQQDQQQQQQNPQQGQPQQGQQQNSTQGQPTNNGGI